MSHSLAFPIILSALHPSPGEAPWAPTGHSCRGQHPLPLSPACLSWRAWICLFLCSSPESHPTMSQWCQWCQSPVGSSWWLLCFRLQGCVCGAICPYFSLSFPFEVNWLCSKAGCWAWAVPAPEYRCWGCLELFSLFCWLGVCLFGGCFVLLCFKLFWCSIAKVAEDFLCSSFLKQPPKSSFLGLVMADF